MTELSSEAKLLALLMRLGMAHFFQPMMDYGFDQYDDFRFVINNPKACAELLREIGMSYEAWNVVLNVYLNENFTN